MRNIILLTDPHGVHHAYGSIAAMLNDPNCPIKIGARQFNNLKDKGWPVQYAGCTIYRLPLITTSDSKNIKMSKSLENIKPTDVETGQSWGTWSPSGREVKTSFIRSDGMIICRSDEGNRFAVVQQIAQLKKTDNAGKGWKIEEISEREHKDGVFIERTYSGHGLDYLFE